MEEFISWFNQVLTTSLSLHFGQECKHTSLDELQPPATSWLAEATTIHEMSLDEQLVIMLTLMPHLCPQILDILFVQNKNLDRPHNEFGGWKGVSHGGFLPTGETAAFILAGSNTERRKDVIALFQKEHWFYSLNILRLEDVGQGEPLLSGQLRVSEEFIHRILFNKEYKPDYNIGFPAKLITTELNWQDLVLDYSVASELDEINKWIASKETIMNERGLSRFLKAGYRSLFYGPAGTGKTLVATLIGKKNGMDVYRIDLSMVVSKYIGETEKNLARVFDLAKNRDWILFFDEADALFGKRTTTNTSNDRHANSEVSYLLQRIEDFQGIVILATNLRNNIDEAFSRRFQSIIYFPMPSQELRAEIWQTMLPAQWLGNGAAELIELASQTELSGGSITNVVRRCALQLVSGKQAELSKEILKDALQKERLKL